MNINAGSQFITFDYRHPAKGKDFDRLNRDVVKPGIYKGLTIFFTGNIVIVTSGSAVLNCSYNNEDILQVKIDFQSAYAYSGAVLPSVFGDKEVLYLEYEFGQVVQNYADFKRMSSSQYFSSNPTNTVVIAELEFNGLNQIIGIDYSNKSWGSINADASWTVPDKTVYHDTDSYSTKWRLDGSLLPTGLRDLQYQTFNESTGRILTTSPTNTTEVENKLSIGSTEDSSSSSTGALVIQGGLGVVKKLYVGSTDDSSSSSTGGLVVNGGVGIGKKLYVGSSQDSSSSSTGSLVVTGGAGIGKKLYIGSTDDSTSTSTGALVVNGGVGIVKRLSVGQFDGRVPLGGVIAIVGTRTASNNGGSPNTPSGIPSTGTISNDGFQRCDGAAVGSGATLTGFLPKIDDDRFIQGSTSLGLLSSDTGVNNGDNTVTLTTSEMPSHNHGGSTGGESSHSHGISGLSGSLSNPVIGAGGGVGGAGPYIVASNSSDGIRRGVSFEADISVSNGSTGSGSNHSHSISSQGGGASFDIRHKYISAIYLMRVR